MRSRKSRLSPARSAAYVALKVIRQRKAFAQEVISKHIDRSDLIASDRAFATKLVLGVVSTVGTLDLVLNRCMRSPEDIKVDVRDALRISAYEALFLDKPDHVVVDQGVELVGAIAHSAKGLANHVLRRLMEQKRVFPYGDPEKSIESFSLMEGFPLWLTEYTISVLGRDDGREFIRANNAPAPIFLALNRTRCDKGDFEEKLERLGMVFSEVTIDDIDIPGCYRLEDRKALADKRLLKLIDKGIALVSDASAQGIVSITANAIIDSMIEDDREGSETGRNVPVRSIRFLESCSGRGTKTILFQSAFYSSIGSQIEHYVCIDNVAFKNKILEERCKDYGIDVEKALTEDISSEDADTFYDSYDAIFIDAPCSGIGTMRRHPEIRWKASPEAIMENARRDDRILERASKLLSVGGIMAYSTCTIAPEENQLRILGFMDSDVGRHFEIVPIHGRSTFQTITKADGYDSHFLCLLKRIS